MGRNLILAMVSSLLLVADVSGDGKLPTLPKGQRIAEPLLRFEGIDKLPDFVFHLSCSPSYFDNERIGTKKDRTTRRVEVPLKDVLVEVRGKGTLQLEYGLPKDFKDRFLPVLPNVRLSLLAMGRKAFDQRWKDDPSLRWLTASADGVLSAALDPPETTVPIKATETPVTTYRVLIKGGKLNAEKVDVKKDYEEEAATLLPPWTLGIAGSVSVAWLGLWFARRGVPARPQRR